MLFIKIINHTYVILLEKMSIYFHISVASFLLMYTVYENYVHIFSYKLKS